MNLENIIAPILGISFVTYLIYKALRHLAEEHDGKGKRNFIIFSIIYFLTFLFIFIRNQNKTSYFDLKNYLVLFIVAFFVAWVIAVIFQAVEKTNWKMVRENYNEKRVLYSLFFALTIPFYSLSLAVGFNVIQDYSVRAVVTKLDFLLFLFFVSLLICGIGWIGIMCVSNGIIIPLKYRNGFVRKQVNENLDSFLNLLLWPASLIIFVDFARESNAFQPFSPNDVLKEGGLIGWSIFMLICFAAIYSDIKDTDFSWGTTLLQKKVIIGFFVTAIALTIGLFVVFFAGDPYVGKWIDETGSIYEFFPDGTASWPIYGNPLTGKYTKPDSSHLKFEFSFPQFGSSASLYDTKFNGDNLTLSISNSPVSRTIILTRYKVVEPSLDALIGAWQSEAGYSICPGTNNSSDAEFAFREIFFYKDGTLTSALTNYLGGIGGRFSLDGDTLSVTTDAISYEAYGFLRPVVINATKAQCKISLSATKLTLQDNGNTTRIYIKKK